MSGGTIGGVIGAIIGGITTQSFQGAMYGWMIGSAAGSIIMPPDLGTQYGPRLDDLKFESSQYGSPIPIVYGTVALQGTVIWAKDIKEVQTQTDSGGKGGPTQTTVNYSYYGTFAVAVCEGPVKKFLRIWAGLDKRLIYDGVSIEGGQVRFYLGTDSQQPDPLIEADKGVGMTPAYRGTAYVVFEDFPLAKDGNRLPLLTFEVMTGEDGGTCGVDYTFVQPPGMGQTRTYSRPPIKLGTIDAGLSGGLGQSRNVATDNNGNIYMLLLDNGRNWYLKRVSYTDPIQETTLALGSQFNGLGCKMAYDPNADMLGIIQTSAPVFGLVDCGSFTVVQVSTTNYYKCDIVYSVSEGRFRFMNARVEKVNGQLDADNWGVDHIYGTATLIECGPHGMAVAFDTLLMRQYTQTCLNGVPITNICASIYDPVRDRLIALNGLWDGYTGYYEFSTGQTVVPVDTGTQPRGNITYSPQHDRIFYSGGGVGLVVMNPADLTPQAFPDECTLIPIHTGVTYGDGVSLVNLNGDFRPVPLPGVANRIAVAMSASQADVFTFAVNGASAAGVTLASVVADLSERAGMPHYDVSQLQNDIVDGYVIARQTSVQAAIQPLRTAYYFDATESQGIVRFVKRGGGHVTVIDDADLAARDGGSEPPDPLATQRGMEDELPRSMTITYLLAATDYEQATKQTRRLIGASGTEQTIEVPLVLSEAKAQEVVEINLASAWAGRVSYKFAVSRKYSDLEPTDLVLVKRNLMRLTSITATPSGILQCEAISDESDFYNRDVVVTETPSNGGLVDGPGFTRLEVF